MGNVRALQKLQLLNNSYVSFNFFNYYNIHCFAVINCFIFTSFPWQFWHKWYPQGLTYFNDGGGPTEVHILYPKKSQLQDLSTQKIPTFFSIPKKIPQCFCISKFYYLSSGKLKHANFNFGFGQKQNYKLHLCYFWFELMKNTIPKKIPLLFSRPKKIPASFVDPKKSLLAKMSDPKKSFGPPPPPPLKYVSGTPGVVPLPV